MLDSTSAVAEAAYLESERVLCETAAETVIVGCTIVAACYEKAVLEGNDKLRGVSVMNPNLMAIKQAEALADMAARGLYRISRKGYYQSVREHSPEQANELERLLSE
jgi:allantoin racemase